MNLPVPRDSVVVSKWSLLARDPSRIVASNADFLTSLFEEGIALEVISYEALCSYFVASYLDQMKAGGIRQFMRCSGSIIEIMNSVDVGLQRMGAERHLELFREVQYFASRQSRLSPGSPVGEQDLSATGGDLFELNERIWEIDELENLTILNGNWLRSRPKIVALSALEIQREVRSRGYATEDRKNRLAEMRRSESSGFHGIRQLCAGEHRHNLSPRGMAISPERTPPAWYFFVERANYYPVDFGGKIIMINVPAEIMWDF